MDLKGYTDVLKFAIQLQVDEVNKELSADIILNEDYLQGVKRGLQIALDKIEASMFLVDKEWFKMLEIKQERGVYYLYIDGKFYCTCDNNREVEEERESLQKNNLILSWNIKAPTEKMLVLFAVVKR